MKKRAFALLLCLSMLTGCGAVEVTAEGSGEVPLTNANTGNSWGTITDNPFAGYSRDLLSIWEEIYPGVEPEIEDPDNPLGLPLNDASIYNQDYVVNGIPLFTSDVALTDESRAAASKLVELYSKPYADWTESDYQTFEACMVETSPAVDETFDEISTGEPFDASDYEPLRENMDTNTAVQYVYFKQYMDVTDMYFILWDYNTQEVVATNRTRHVAGEEGDETVEFTLTEEQKQFFKGQPADVFDRFLDACGLGSIAQGGYTDLEGHTSAISNRTGNCYRELLHDGFYPISITSRIDYDEHVDYVTMDIHGYDTYIGLWDAYRVGVYVTAGGSYRSDDDVCGCGCGNTLSTECCDGEEAQEICE